MTRRRIPFDPDRPRSISVNLTPDTERRLRQAADERVVSITYLVDRAVDRFLDELPPLDGAR